MPSRTYNAMAAGKPLLGIVEKDSETDQVINEGQIGWTVSPQKPDELLVTIKEILRSTEKLPELGDRARQQAIRDYSLEKAIGLYRKALIMSERT